MTRMAFLCDSVNLEEKGRHNVNIKVCFRIFVFILRSYPFREKLSTVQCDDDDYCSVHIQTLSYLISLPLNPNKVSYIKDKA